MGCFGTPMSAANTKRCCDNHEYNRQAAHTSMIQAVSADTFGFDCVRFIKGLLWGCAATNGDHGNVAANGVKWLYVQYTYKGTTYTGFCSSNYLTK